MMPIQYLRAALAERLAYIEGEGTAWQLAEERVTSCH